MEIEKLRVTKDSHEIRTFLKDYVTTKTEVLLWQNLDQKGKNGAKRVIFKGKFILLNENKNFLLLKFELGNGEEIPFEFTSTLYIKGNLQSVLFKIEISHHSKGTILLPIPQEMRVLEKREKPRFNFGVYSEGKVEFFNYKTMRTNRKHNSAKLIDVSQGGLAMLMYTGKVHSWSEGDRFHIMRINSQTFTDTIVATINYIMPIEIERNNQTISAYRIGVHFDRDLTSSELTTILKENRALDSEGKESA